MKSLIVLLMLALPIMTQSGSETSAGLAINSVAEILPPAKVEPIIEPEQITPQKIVLGGPVVNTLESKPAESDRPADTFIPQAMNDLFVYPTTGYNYAFLHGNNGVDIENNCGTPIFAVAEGTIITAQDSGYNDGYGNNIWIQHSNGVITVYAHLSKLLITQNNFVAKGQQIAEMGTTGRSSACHLHFEVHGISNSLARW